MAACAVLFLMKQHIAAPPMRISQAEFLDKFASNQIVRATVMINQQTMPLAEIIGTFWETDKDGKVTKEEIPFAVYNALLTGDVQNELSHSPKISFSTPSLIQTSLLWNLAPFLIMGVLFWFFFMRQIKKR
jgi:hypothetical protein